MALLVSLLMLQPDISQGHVESARAVTSASELTLIVDFGNGTVFDTTELSGENVLEVTQSVYAVTVDWAGSLAFVTAIEGVQNTQTQAWQYWVNGVYASVACNVYELESYDIIVWNRTISGYSGPPTGQRTSELILGATLIAGFGVVVLVGLYLVVNRRS